MSLADVVFRIVGSGPTRYPEPPDDLVRESERARLAAERATIAAGYAPDSEGNYTDREPLPNTWGWPDPYGPDPVVFGSAPRFKNPMDD